MRHNSSNPESTDREEKSKVQGSQTLQRGLDMLDQVVGADPEQNGQVDEPVTANCLEERGPHPCHSIRGGSNRAPERR